jgi:hypothetical protein
MLLKTILNRCQKFKCFVYSEVKFTDHQGSACIEAWIEPRKNSKAICSGCGTAQPGYDTNLEPRRFEFIPVWGIPVFFLYFMRRVDCKMCGVRTEQVPWGEGKKTADQGVHAISRQLGSGTVLAGSRKTFSHELGEGFSLSRIRRRMGS